MQLGDAGLRVGICPSFYKYSDDSYPQRYLVLGVQLISNEANPGQVPRSPSAVSEARIDRRIMCGQAARARFRYSDLKEAARRRTRALWGLNGMEGWCPGVSSCCRGARKTTADALEFSETQDDRGIKTGEAGKSRFVEAPGTERLRTLRHAKIS